MDNKILLVAVATIVLAAPALGARYCATDDDCSDLGDLKCVYSMCPAKGICGCERNKVAKWMGSTMLFQCVPLRKVGQRCSNIDVTGACGAPYSFCNETKNNDGEWEGWCYCRDGFLPEHGGEACTHISDFHASVDGETCQADGYCSGYRNCDSASDAMYDPVQGHQYTCGCSESQTLILDYSASTPFTDRLQPKCFTKKLGDPCRTNTGCSHIGNAECGDSAGTCQCRSGYSQNYDGNGCIDNTDTKLGFGGNCTAGWPGECDASAGLVCGDVCAWETQTVRKCECGRGHKTSGSTCVKINLGDPCYGDMNCNVENHLAICVDGTCTDGSSAIKNDLKTLDDENAAGAMFVTWPLLAAAIISRFL